MWPCVGLAVLFAGGGALGALFSLGGDDEGPSEREALIHCRDVVREQLRDPDSAEFSDETTSGHGNYTIEGTVRADNALGGTVTHAYTCTADWDESDGSYAVRARLD